MNFNEKLTLLSRRLLAQVVDFSLTAMISLALMKIAHTFNSATEREITTNLDFALVYPLFTAVMIVYHGYFYERFSATPGKR